MKKPITPIGIIAVFLVFILAQSSVSYSSMPTVTNSESSFSVRDTVPEQDTMPDKKKKKDKKKDRKDKDTSNWPQPNNPTPDTFPSANRP